MSLSTEIILTLTETLELSLNRLLKQDQDTLKKLSALQGKVIAFDISDLNLTFFLFPHSEGIQIQYLYQQQADTTLQGNALAFINMSLGDSTESFFSGDVRIKGDIELGQRFKRIFDQLDFDWEEWLAAYTGDLIAFKAGSFVRELNAWGQDAINTLKLDVREYTQDEGNLAPHPEDIQKFVQDIGDLRDQTARLQARITRLQKHITTTA